MMDASSTSKDTNLGPLRIIRLALVSVGNYLKMVAAGTLHLGRDRLNRSYQVGSHGKFLVFRESFSSRSHSRDPVVLVVGFRLKLIGDSRVMHWLFQRVCILTTPFWSGFHGFDTKLWMVSRGHDYLGIYQWFGRPEALTYVSTLTRVLVPLSTPHSVWYELYPQTLDDYLGSIKGESMGKVNVEWHERHIMPKHPSEKERLQWHAEHIKHCHCHPLPDKLRLQLEAADLL